MSGGIKIGFVDFVEFSSEIDRVRCSLMRSFLVRNWCGARLVLALRDGAGGPESKGDGDTLRVQS
jgi:hypothetical protein